MNVEIFFPYKNIFKTWPTFIFLFYISGAKKCKFCEQIQNRLRYEKEGDIQKTFLITRIQDVDEVRWFIMIWSEDCAKIVVKRGKILRWEKWKDIESGNCLRGKFLFVKEWTSPISIISGNTSTREKTYKENVKSNRMVQ